MNKNMFQTNEDSDRDCLLALKKEKDRLMGQQTSLLFKIGNELRRWQQEVLFVVVYPDFVGLRKSGDMYFLCYVSPDFVRIPVAIVKN